jgi:hypothetical protein
MEDHHDYEPAWGTAGPAEQRSTGAVQGFLRDGLQMLAQELINAEVQGAELH